MSYYRTCPDCGAALDPGEKCTCNAPAPSSEDLPMESRKAAPDACKCEPIYISVEQAAELLSVSKTTVYNLTHAEGFPKANIGHRTVIHLDGLREWARKQVGNE